MKHNRFARRMAGMSASEVREILKVTERPEILSFAGGLPAPELFPTKELAVQAKALLEEEGIRALQYAPTEGYLPLREWICERMNTVWGSQVTPSEILITSGSQQGLDLTTKVFLDEGDLVWCESPTYLAALGAFNAAMPRYEEMVTDQDGVILDGLEERLKKTPPKMVYVIPTFQNPSGRTWSMERRRGFMELMTKYGIPVIEDNAYYEVRFDEVEYCSLKSFDPEGLVVSLASFSKVLCPGLRVAWVAASPEIISRYIIIKQSTDLQTSNFNQMLIYRFLKNHDFDQRLEQLRDTYRIRRDAMVAALEEELPEGVNFTRPAGGMFIWLEMPENIDAHALLQRCLKAFVAFVPGFTFYPENGRRNTARLNFSNLPPEKIRQGVRAFAHCLAEEMEARQPQAALSAEK
ncbi:MAG: PLP-dependent aminotransferase family protein [Candidatus Xenobium sp.]|jgi:2-aminoadipate transaminase|nr:PLP-dependent aminotransferase family protein [Burkholderiales bacterium]